MNEIVRSDIIENHIEEANYLFPIIDVQFLKNNLTERNKITEKLIEEASPELTLKDLVAFPERSPKKSS